MNKGWIKLYRSLKDWEWYDDLNARVLLIHLLISVNYEDKKWKGVLVKKGSMILSWRTLSTGCGLSVKKCRVAMDKLEKANEVARYVANKYQLVSLVKWDKLQQLEEQDGNVEGNVEGKQKAGKGQAKGKQRATTKETNNTKNKRNKEIKNIFLSEVKTSELEGNEILYFEIAKAFQQLFIKNISENGGSDKNQKEAKYKVYVNPIRLMIEKDGVTKQQIMTVWKFLGSTDGDFWKPNILSTSKLREKFTQLIIKANQNGNRSNNNGNTSETNLGKIYADIDEMYGNE